MAETILFLCAHNDDQIIGGGGTFAKYASQGKKLKTIIFSYGEKSHPHLKRNVIVKARIKEAKKADKILGGKGLTFLGISEGKFSEEIRKYGIKEKLIEIIAKEKPSKIFTHSIDDPHPDHKAVYKLMAQILKERKLNCDVYSFDVWNPLTIRKRNVPKLVVDMTATFPKKIKAYDAHESQVNLPLMIPMRIKIHLHALLHGWANHCKYAEVFRKLN